MDQNLVRIIPHHATITLIDAIVVHSLTVARENLRKCCTKDENTA